MADSPQDENTIDKEGQVTGTHTGSTPVQQGTDRTDGSDKLTYGNPAEDKSKLPDVNVTINQQPEQ